MSEQARERAALLAAVIEQPNDEARRRVFADWLEEHGEEATAAALRQRGTTSLHQPFIALEGFATGMAVVPIPGTQLAVRATPANTRLIGWAPRIVRAGESFLVLPRGGYSTRRADARQFLALLAAVPSCARCGRQLGADEGTPVETQDGPQTVCQTCYGWVTSPFAGE